MDKVTINKFEEILILLSKFGANFSIVDKRCKTSLLYLSGSSEAEPEWLDIMNFDSPDQYNHQDNKGRTPLLRCIQQSNLNFTVSLVKKGADVNFSNKHGATPLFFSLIFQGLFLKILFLIFSYFVSFFFFFNLAFSGSNRLFCPLKNFNRRKRSNFFDLFLFFIFIIFIFYFYYFHFLFLFFIFPN